MRQVTRELRSHLSQLRNPRSDEEHSEVTVGRRKEENVRDIRTVKDGQDEASQQVEGRSKRGD